MPTSSPIVDYLAALRTTVRRRLFAYGLFAVLAGGLVALLTIVLLDWILWLPALLRLIGGMLFVVGFILALVHWVVRPLQAKIGAEELAARLERQFEGFHDQLSSTVDFLQKSTPASSAMVRRVVADTERMLQRLPLQTALTIRPLAVGAGVFTLGTMVFLGIAALAPSWMKTGLVRYVDPWGATQWPKSTAIRAITHDQTVALGESAIVRMAVDRGLHDALRGVVHLAGRDGQTQALALQRDADGTFTTTIDAITDDLTYWFEAGDDVTRGSPSVIHVVRRPEVVEALAAVEPPPYAMARTPRVVDLAESGVSAPIGGFVTVTLRASKPVVTEGPQGAVGLRTEAGMMIPLAIDAQDPRQLSGRMEVIEDLVFRAELRDELGLSNRGAATYSIRAVPDTPPSVIVLEPAAVVEVTPLGSLRMTARVEDDFGITRLDLHAEGFRDGREVVVPLLNRLLISRQDEGVEGTASFVWEFEPLGATPGEVVSCAVVVVDNHVGPTDDGQTGRSTPFRIKFISPSEFEIRLREDLTALEARLRQAIVDQADLHDRTTALVETDEALSPLTDTQRDVAAGLSGGQSRLAQHLRDLSTRLQEVVGRMQLNHSAESEDRERLRESAEELRRVATGPLTDAAGRLGRVYEQTSPEIQQQELHTAASSQADALERLSAVLRKMSEWGAFQGLVARTRDLLDRQNILRAQTGETAPTTLGKPVESLTPTEAAALKRLERQQDQLADDLERHLANLEQMSSATRDKDPSGAEAIDDALRVARANEAQKRVRAAAEAIQSNRTAAATLDQRAAADALRKMIAALRERDERELAQLRKRLEQAEELVADLIRQQQELQTATHEAGALQADDTAFSTLSGQQRTLARNTRMLSDDIAQFARAMSASRHVRLAADPMNRAETELRTRQAQVAEPAQTEALQHLANALADLEALVQEDAEAGFRRTLTQIQEELQAVLDAQRPISDGVRKLHAARDGEGRAARAESREAAKLARDQGDVQTMVTEALSDFEKAPVYEWALQRVVQWMETTRSSLDSRKIDADLVSTAARIVRELEKLVGALSETQSMPGITEFAEAEGEGGGGQESDNSSTPTVPSVAELLVLKAMQSDINERTQRFSVEFDADAASEDQLRQLAIVGEDQGEVRRLTERVTQKARGQHGD